MTTADPGTEPMYDAIGRVIAAAARVEHALTTLAVAAAAAAELDPTAPKNEVHGKPLGSILAVVVKAAEVQPPQWWSAPAKDLVDRAEEMLHVRNALAHGTVTDHTSLGSGLKYVVMKPATRKSNPTDPVGTEKWWAYKLSRDQLLTYVAQLVEFRAEIQAVGDRLLDEVRPAVAAQNPPPTSGVLLENGLLSTSSSAGKQDG